MKYNKLSLLTISITFEDLQAIIARALKRPAILVLAFAWFWLKPMNVPAGIVLSEPGDWDRAEVSKPSVLKDKAVYKMWYDGTDKYGKTQIGLVTSIDGKEWAKYAENPVLSGGPEGWDLLGEHAPFVIKVGDVYKMWYEGSDGSVRQLGYAISQDGIHWTKDTHNPVLQAGPEVYDKAVAGHGTVLQDGGIYRLWYHAIGDQGIIIAYATSPDGINWTKQGPVLLPQSGGWDSGGLWGPSVIMVNGAYWMWYSAARPDHPTSIGVATSTDGVNWTRSLGGPVITDTVRGNNIGDPHVVRDGEIFRMWYQDFDQGAIYSAESGDGIHWINFSASPALQPDPFCVYLPIAIR